MIQLGVTASHARCVEMLLCCNVHCNLNTLQTGSPSPRSAPLLRTHMVVLGGLEQYPEQPVGRRAAAQRQHCLVQFLLGLQGKQQLRTQCCHIKATLVYIHKLGVLSARCSSTSFSMKNMSICWPKASVTFCSSSLIFSGLWNGMILEKQRKSAGSEVGDRSWCCV